MQDIIDRVPVTRLQMGAHHAFLASGGRNFYIVENGYVDLFSVMADGDDALMRKPFIARVSAGRTFFDAPRRQFIYDGKKVSFAFLAVPSRDAVLLRGEREHFAPPDGFDLDAISAIDDWVTAVSEFVARYEPPPPRDALLLEAEADVPYEAQVAVGAHHLEVLWVSADGPAHFVGRPAFSLPPDRTLPLTEHTWLTLPEAAHVSAVHTPGAIVTGRLWSALDRLNHQILLCAATYWAEKGSDKATQQAESRMHRARVRSAMLRDLTSLLGDAPAAGETVAGNRSPLSAAAAVVAGAAGVQLADRPADLDESDPLEAVGTMVAPSGIRTRHITLAPGWERRDGPSFLGILSETKESRLVAVVNERRGAYKAVDAVTGSAVPVDRRLAESLGTQGTMFYAPLARGVDSGIAAIRQVLRGRGRDITGVILMGALGAVIALLVPVVTGQLLGEIIPRVDIPMWVAALAALVIGAFASAAVSIVGAFCLLRIEARIDETLQAAIWSRLLSLPLPFFSRYLAGDLADRANGVSLIRQMLTGATGSSLVGGVFSIFSYGLLFYYSWELALWAGAAMLVLSAATWFFATRQIRHHRAVFMAQGAIDGLVFQIIMGVAKIRQAHAEIRALKRWSERYVEQKRELLSARKWGAGQHAFNALFGPLSQLLLLAMIWYSLIEGASPTPFALADFLSFHTAYGQFVAGVTGLTAAWATLVAVLPLFERVLPIIEAQPENVERGVVLPSLSGRIECEDVTFRYPSAVRDTLQSVSFHIRPGEYVAFVGPSGAGKSTLYRMLLGFERPTSGTVLFDGHDLATLDLSAMRKHLGVVLQNGQLVPDSIYRNIASDASVTMSDAWDAARAAGLEDDIKALPMRMQTVLSEGGAGLSGGQKQRILVARALARKPRVLLFDEATSMLDNRTQAIIRATLRNLTATRILIAHRLSTVVDADRIYVMQDGRIVESGPYKDLMARDGVLAELARRQIV